MRPGRPRTGSWPRQNIGGGLSNKDIVVNGGFDADASWTKGDGWTIGSGVASSDGTQAAVSDLAQTTNNIVSGQAYLCTFQVTAFTAGTVTLYIGDTAGTARGATGNFTELLTHTGAGLAVLLQASEDFVGSVDNLVVLVR